MALWVLRACFLIVAVGLGISLAQNSEIADSNYSVNVVVFFSIGAVLMIGLDVLVRRKRIDLITSVYFGLLVGLFLTYIVSLALTPIFLDIDAQDWALSQNTLKTLLTSFSGTAICYLCISVLWQTRDDFRLLFLTSSSPRTSKVPSLMFLIRVLLLTAGLQISLKRV